MMICHVKVLKEEKCSVETLLVDGKDHFDVIEDLRLPNYIVTKVPKYYGLRILVSTVDAFPKHCSYRNLILVTLLTKGNC